jgi:hypothetical protein
LMSVQCRCWCRSARGRDRARSAVLTQTHVQPMESAWWTID